MKLNYFTGLHSYIFYAPAWAYVAEKLSLLIAQN